MPDARLRRHGPKRTGKEKGYIIYRICFMALSTGLHDWTYLNKLVSRHFPLGLLRKYADLHKNSMNWPLHLAEAHFRPLPVHFFQLLISLPVCLFCWLSYLKATARFFAVKMFSHRRNGTKHNWFLEPSSLACDYYTSASFFARHQVHILRIFASSGFDQVVCFHNRQSVITFGRLWQHTI